MCNGLRYHFNMQHWGDMIMILEYPPIPLPRCEICRSQVPEGRLNNRHYASDKCKQGEEMRLRRDTLQRCFKAGRVSFQINAKTLPTSEAFPYSGRTIAYNNSNWSEVYLNLRKSRRGWGMIERVLKSTGSTVQSQGAMYKAVAQLLLPYGSYS